MRKMMLREDGIARRCDQLLFTPAERAIFDAVGVVESAGCHPLLTDAVNLLQEARDKVADYVELPESNITFKGCKPNA